MTRHELECWLYAADYLPSRDEAHAYVTDHPKAAAALYVKYRDTQPAPILPAPKP